MRLFGQLFGQRMEVSGADVYEVAFEFLKKKFTDIQALPVEAQLARFEQLAGVGLKPFDDAELPENESKNRYINVFPFDENRVRLLNSDNGDYINASRIQGNSGENFKFIATQAPLQHTIQDFWLMVLQENVGAIVMLTQDSEVRDGRMQRYFPSTGDEVFGYVRVKLENQMQFNIHTIERQFYVENLQSGDTMEVMHYHYTVWPDHNISSHLKSLLLLVQYILDSFQSSTVVVHCSAGIGRSGTFLTISRIIRRLRQCVSSGAQISQSQIQDACNIEKTIMQLRTQRMGSVQTIVQYFMCYQAILQWLVEQLNQSSNSQAQVNNIPKHRAS
eukprot:TRINITY_DN3479_c0_g4_i2.p1 TRINITY_DN3479_c0_g4~~TRINITY_DN3479_c0_g4_i2.p1  ORF type:complete len:332 (-),score=24.50 TRINITY_DN3479_c0_g4_i2:545-1540(-)